MRDNRRRDDSSIVTAIIVGAVIATFILYTIAKSVGLEPRTFLGVVISFAILIGVSVAAWLYICPAMDFNPHNLWPIIVAAGWYCLWPALDNWAAYPLARSSFVNSDPVWWAAQSTKWIVFFGIIGVGYLIRWVFFRDDYYR